MASIEQSLTATGIRQGRQSATGVDEYLPAQADLTAWRDTSPGTLLLDPPSGLAVVAVEEEGTRIRLDLNSQEATKVRLARWYFPRWRASLNGEPVVVEPGPLGEISMAIPKGRSQLEVHLDPPLVRRTFAWISGLAMVVFLLASAASFLPWFEPHSSS
jgi:hypothetical protein